MVRDAEQHLDALLHSLDEIGCIFNRSAFVIFESNSADETPQIVKRWALRHIDADFCAPLRNNGLRKKNRLWRGAQTAIAAHFGGPSRVEKRVLLNDSRVLPDLLRLRAALNASHLSRVARYAVYRNMMLAQLRELGADFDYLMLVDLDLFSLRSRLLFHELAASGSGSDVVCANGVSAKPYEAMYDSFAAVDSDGQWLHAHTQRLSSFPALRFQAMHSCFGGIALYKSLERVLATRCAYQLVLPSSHAHAEAAEIWNGPPPELQAIADQYEAMLIGAGKEASQRLCEHLSFHHCLRAHAFRISIAKHAKAFYNGKQSLAPLPSRNSGRPKNKRGTLRNKKMDKRVV